MKHLKLLPPLLLFLIAASAEAQGEHSCLYQSTKIEAQYRADYLKACLAWASSPANVEAATLHNKHLRCAQNAKNLALKGDEKADYIKVCMYHNEAEAKKAATQAPTLVDSTTELNSAHK